MCSSRTSLPLRRIFWQVNAVRALKTLTFPFYIKQLEAFSNNYVIPPQDRMGMGIHFDNSFRFSKHNQYE